MVQLSGSLHLSSSCTSLILLGFFSYSTLTSLNLYFFSCLFSIRIPYPYSSQISFSAPSGLDSLQPLYRFSRSCHLLNTSAISICLSIILFIAPTLSTSHPKTLLLQWNSRGLLRKLSEFKQFCPINSQVLSASLKLTFVPHRNFTSRGTMFIAKTVLMVLEDWQSWSQLMLTTGQCHLWHLQMESLRLWQWT